MKRKKEFLELDNLINPQFIFISVQILKWSNKSGNVTTSAKKFQI